jgi:hypothetical protein
LSSASEIYGSHLPVLKAVVPKDAQAIEFGGGEYSTRALLTCQHLYTVENDVEWIAQLRTIGEKENWKLLHAPTLDVMTSLLLGLSYNVAFVDCRPDNWRGQIGTELFKRECPLIIFHDWEAQLNCGYKWMQIPKGYRKAVYHHKVSSVRTAVFSKSKLPAIVPEHEIVLGNHVIRS